MARSKRPRVFLETSVYIRFLTADDDSKYERVKQLFSDIESGAVQAATSSTVLLEVIYVLSKVYRFRHERVVQTIQGLCAMRSLIIVETTDTKRALEIWSSNKLPYGDCCIATEIPTGTLLATFDKDFQKIPNVNLYQW